MGSARAWPGRRSGNVATMPSSVSSNSGSGPVRSAGEGPPLESADAGSTWELGGEAAGEFIPIERWT